MRDISPFLDPGDPFLGIANILWYFSSIPQIVENGLEGPILTHKNDTKCSDMNLNRSGTILKQKVQIWGGKSAPNMTPVNPGGGSQELKTIRNDLEGPILTHKVDAKCFDMNLSRSGTIFE